MDNQNASDMHVAYEVGLIDGIHFAELSHEVRKNFDQLTKYQQAFINTVIEYAPSLSTKLVANLLTEYSNIRDADEEEHPNG